MLLHPHTVMKLKLCLCASFYVCLCTLQAGSMESPSPRMTSLGRGSRQRRCTMSTAGGGWSDLVRERQVLQEPLQRSAEDNKAALLFILQHTYNVFFFFCQEAEFVQHNSDEERKIFGYQFNVTVYNLALVMTVWQWFQLLLTEAGQRRPWGLGILFSDWLEVSQERAFIRHVPSKALEAEDGARRPAWSICHLPTGGSAGE